jgi:hypothetical protein
MAQGAPATRSFEHIKTGFALTGQHANERCESCHQNGVFKGTPRDCASCHLSGTRWSRGNVVMNQNHLPTQLSCDSCHGTQTFTGVQASTTRAWPRRLHELPQRQHRRRARTVPATSRPPPRATPATSGFSGWTPASGFDHSGVVQGTCTTCHNGSPRQRQVGDGHVPVGTRVATVLRTPSTGFGCHRLETQQLGPHADGCGQSVRELPQRWLSRRPTGATPTTSLCQSVAGAAIGQLRQLPQERLLVLDTGRASMPRVSVSSSAPAATPAALRVRWASPTRHPRRRDGNCETLPQVTSSWAGAKVDHSTFTAATNCATCHNGSTATGKSATHVPAATNCFSCHSVTGWKPTKWNHTQVAVTAQCASCHTGGFPPADGRSANHVPYQTVQRHWRSANCDSCHKRASRLGAGAVHANGVDQHATASAATPAAFAPAVGKPNNTTHAGVTGNCESCHKSTTSWSAAKVDHSALPRPPTARPATTATRPPASRPRTCRSARPTASAATASPAGRRRSGTTRRPP